MAQEYIAFQRIARGVPMKDRFELASSFIGQATLSKTHVPIHAKLLRKRKKSDRNDTCETCCTRPIRRYHAVLEHRKLRTK